MKRSDAFPVTAQPGEWLAEPITIHEVGPRDGLQAESTLTSAEEKIAFCTDLVNAGLKSIEVASFVRPDLVPQMADAEAVVKGLPRTPGVKFTALVPNLRGLARALDAQIDAVGVFASATESFAQANMNTSADNSIKQAAEVVSEARSAGVPSRAYLSMCFGDPWEGQVDRAAVVARSADLLEAGAEKVVISDTIGVAHAAQVEVLLEDLYEAGFAPSNIAVHFHDTYGQALANVAAAIRTGVREVDSSAGGLGRCPFAPGATGNLATEDLLWFLQGAGINTDIDLRKVAEATDWFDRKKGSTSASAVKRALAA